LEKEKFEENKRLERQKLDDGKNIVVQYGQERVAYDEQGNEVEMREGDR
jgi:hypothetical protein